MVEFDPEGDAVFYPLLRAVDAFHSSLNRFPGEAGLEDDIPTLKTHLVNVLNGGRMLWESRGTVERRRTVETGGEMLWRGWGRLIFRCVLLCIR